MFGGNLLSLPVHTGGLPVVDLHTVHPDITLARFRSPCDDTRKRDEGPAVLRPGFENGQFEKIDICATPNDLLTWRVFSSDYFGKEATYFGEGWKQFELVHEASRSLWFDQTANAVGDGVERIGLKGEPQTAFAAELIHQDPSTRITLHVFKE